MVRIMASWSPTVGLCFALWLVVSADAVTLNSLERNSAASKVKLGDGVDYRNADSTDSSPMTNRNASATPATPLTCHQCHSFVDGDSCVHLAADNSNFSKKCNPSQTSCMVKRFSYTENATSTSLIWSVARNCSSKCEPGCLILGERTKLYVCTSCCKDSDCNTGSEASLLTHSITFPLSVAVLVHLVQNFPLKNILSI